MGLKKRCFMVLAAMLPSMSAMAIQELPILTGTWEGKIVCSGTASGKGKTKLTLDKVKLMISQTGNTISIDREIENSLDTTYPDYTGFVIADLKKPTAKGQAAITHCRSSNNISSGAYSELTSLSVTVDRAKAKGTLKGASMYTTPESLNQVHEVGQCKWQFKLIDTVEPLVPAGCLLE